MRARQSFANLLVAIGTGALLVLVVVLVTGGFVVDAGPIRFSARRSTGPLLIALGAWLAVARLGRDALARSAAEIAPFLDRHAAAVAVVLAAACAGVGVAFGTYSASSADPSGYVSHASLVSSGRLVQDEPLAESLDWPDGTWSITPLGYRPGRARGELVPGYPLGLPLVMAGAGLLLGEIGPFAVVPLFGAALVLGVFWLGVHLHSRVAGLVAASFVATSPVVLFHVVQPMSDVPAAAWIVLAIVAAIASARRSAGSEEGPARSAGRPDSSRTTPEARRSRPTRLALLAGFAFGMAVATRPTLAPLGLVVAACAAGWPRIGQHAPSGRRQLFVVALGFVPVAAALMATQWRLFGSPVATGYGGLDQYFALPNIGANVRDYAWRVARGEGAALGLVAAALVTCGLGRAMGTTNAPHPVQRGLFHRLRASHFVAVAVSALTLVVYLPYGVFPDWSYLRFLLPALALGFVLVGAVVSEAVHTMPAWARGAALAVAVTLVCAANTVVAGREQVFNLRHYESRYRSVGRYLAASLPANAVVVTSQESGSVAHYTGRPVVRWDLLSVDLDDALQALRSHDRHPVLVVEDWERPLLRARFPRSAAALLDWTPRADIGVTTRVWVLDPADRPRGGAVATDRFR